jgi:hypothetical protein
MEEVRKKECHVSRSFNEEKKVVTGGRGEVKPEVVLKYTQKQKQKK